ncbi:(deoxy)nucleoside triphosphate pyrophosphohydrolase [Paratractidigestivibacter sp.]|uniref:(deoxy)nucleoside triphosphate pyrophosphohydrolase n=1 Tax=Paratractidigestivibacter sp. TaxID=2847316 RepID=UPI002ABE4A5A|nr:(deoxy)nucleoside triphosphate pyrophosphohydrolase [Paratractidigestivibacter sp.]
MNTIRVACAIIQNNNKEVLAAKRADVSDGPAWEFPGGKVEDGESAEDALRREIDEELGCKLQLVLPFDAVEHDYPDFHLSMEAFVCTLAPSVTPEPREHSELKWVNKDQLTCVDWLPADHELTLKLGMFWDMFFAEEHL